MFNDEVIRRIVREEGLMPDEDHFCLAQCIVDLFIELGCAQEIKKYFYKN